jgi:hypothetical protein
LEKPKRQQVVKALEQAIEVYSKIRSAKTGTKTKGVYEW